jgi:hypothetical protein
LVELVATVTALVTVGFSFDDELHLNPVRKGLVKRPEDWAWSSYNDFAWDRATVAARPILIDDLRLPLGHRA